MTLKEIFQKYPFKVKEVAGNVGYSAGWLDGLISGKMLLTPEKKEQNLEILQDYFRKVGKDLVQTKLNDENDIKKIIDKHNLTISKISVKLNKSDEWLPSLMKGRYRLSEKRKAEKFKIVKDYFSKIGQELSGIIVEESLPGREENRRTYKIFVGGIEYTEIQTENIIFELKYLKKIRPGLEIYAKEVKKNKVISNPIKLKDAQIII